MKVYEGPQGLRSKAASLRLNVPSGPTVPVKVPPLPAAFGSCVTPMLGEASPCDSRMLPLVEMATWVRRDTEVAGSGLTILNGAPKASAVSSKAACPKSTSRKSALPSVDSAIIFVLMSTAAASTSLDWKRLASGPRSATESVFFVQV